jgi:hypothetical protein
MSGGRLEEIPGPVILCDPEGVIVDMNTRAELAYQKDGGRALIGTNMIDCHPEPSRSKVRELLKSREVNVYSIEKRGTRRLIYQAPWIVDGEYRGLIEIQLEIPPNIPHFVRKG